MKERSFVPKFSIITNPTTLSAEKVEVIETLCNTAFGKDNNSPDSFNGILAKRPGVLSIVEDRMSDEIAHVSIIESDTRNTLVYLSLSATEPEFQGQGLASHALSHALKQLFTGSIDVVARTQNPIEVSAFSRAAQNMHSPTPSWPFFDGFAFVDVSALISAKTPHKGKIIWDGNTADLRKSISRGAYKNLAEPNMIKHIENQIDWNNPTAKTMEQFWEENNLDRNQGDAIFMVFNAIIINSRDWNIKL